MTNSDFDDYYITAVNQVGKSTAKVELVQLPSIVLNDLSDSFTSPTTTTTETNSKNKNLRNSLNKLLNDSDKKKSYKYEDSNNIENEFIFFKTTSSIQLTKQNRSTKYSSFRSNKQNNVTNSNHLKVKSQRKPVEDLELSTSTTSYHFFDIVNKSSRSSLFFSSKFHFIFIQLLSFYTFSIVM